MAGTNDYQGEPEFAQPVAPPPKGRGALFFIVIILAVLFVLGICMVGVFATLLTPALLKAKMKANETKCGNNLKQLGLAAIQYADDNRYFPNVPSDPTGRKAMELLVPKYCDSSQVFTCPCQEDGDFSYEGFPVLITMNVSSSKPIAWDKNPHPDGSRCVVFADCHTQRVDEATFQELLVIAREPQKQR
jgi:hypothetical protein